MKIKNINDYVDEVALKFPELTRDEVKRILVYGWKMILLYVSAGNDVSIHNGKFFFFIGELTYNSLSNFKTYCYKLAKRIAFMYYRVRGTWDGYYYFALDENKYKDYLSQSRKKYKIYKNIMLYKLLDECKVTESNCLYIFRLKEDRTKYIKKFYKEIKTDKAELVILRDPINMQDLMTSLNKYKYIQ